GAGVLVALALRAVIRVLLRTRGVSSPGRARSARSARAAARWALSTRRASTSSSLRIPCQPAMPFLRANSAGAFLVDASNLLRVMRHYSGACPDQARRKGIPQVTPGDVRVACH